MLIFYYKKAYLMQKSQYKIAKKHKCLTLCYDLIGGIFFGYVTGAVQYWGGQLNF